MNRFTLCPNTWYACELIGDEFSQDKCSYSPIKVYEFHPVGVGDRSFVLEFFHANYPEGVQDKSYRLQTVHRGESLILARATDYEPARFLQLYEITAEWLNEHFKSATRVTESPQIYLDRAYNAPNKAD